MRCRAEAEQEKELIARAFEFLDSDGSKTLSFSEFKVVMTDVGDALTHQELELFFKLVSRVWEAAGVSSVGLGVWRYGVVR